MRLIITCDQAPAPPLDGHNRKTHDLLCGIIDKVETNVLVYARNEEHWAKICEYWSQSPLHIHRISNHQERVFWLALRNRYSLPMARRNYEEEKQVFERIRAGDRSCVGLIDFLYGAPLLSTVHGPIIVSGHDCMSHLFRMESRCSHNLQKRLTFFLRSILADVNERRYYHLADIVHVVSEQDARKLRDKDPRISTCVIPLGRGEPDVRVFRPYERRGRKLIWGNINSPAVLKGLKDLFAEAMANGNHVLEGFTLLGSASEKSAFQKLPQMRHCGIKYISRIDDISAFLGDTKLVILPDHSGSGQKNRTVDSLAHGCLIIGTEEVFRSVPQRNGQAFVNARNPKGIIRSLAMGIDSAAASIAENGRQLFIRELSLPALTERWIRLLNEVASRYR